MVQVDVAGPRLPRTFDISPNDIREMATEVLDGCVNGPFNIGGFATSNLQVMENWITAEETKFDRPFRMSRPILHPGLSQGEAATPQLTTLLPQQHPPHSSQ